jgi:glycerol-3-phosphate acyltransferase PlsY
VGVATAATLLRAGRRPGKASLFCLFTLGFLVYRHQDNLDRLRRGEEHRLGDQINAAKAGALLGQES